MDYFLFSGGGLTVFGGVVNVVFRPLPQTLLLTHGIAGTRFVSHGSTGTVNIGFRYHAAPGPRSVDPYFVSYPTPTFSKFGNHWVHVTSNHRVWGHFGRHGLVSASHGLGLSAKIHLRCVSVWVCVDLG